MSQGLFDLLFNITHNQTATAVILFILGLILLIKGGDWFVDGACDIAKKFKVPEILIGATVVSIGTTLPEVMVSATSAIKGSGDIAYGNAIGSIICNTALICALTITIKPAPVKSAELKLPVAFFFASSALYMIIAYFFGYFSRIAGAILLCVFLIYMTVSIIKAKRTTTITTQEETDFSKRDTVKMFVLIVIGAALVAFGSDLLVDNGIVLAESIGVPKSVIALTFVALGTSLPEFVTAITSLIKGHGALSLGNIIGANLFNLVFVSSVAPLLSPFRIPTEKTVFGLNASLIIDIPVMVIVMSILTIPALLRGKLSRIQGIILLLIYTAFCAFQFAM